MTRMTAPTSIDNAEVHATASVDPTRDTGRTNHVVAGELANARIRRLAVARYEDQPGIYLFYRDDACTVITDTFHEDVASALDQARFEYSNVSFNELSDGP
jgi:hypothetical protein